MSYMYDIKNEPMLVARLINFELHIIPCLSSIQIIGRLFLNPYLSCFLYVCNACLRWFIFQVIKKNSSAASVLNSYNFTILRSVFYSRNIWVSNRNKHFVYIHSYLMLLFLLVFAVRSVDFFPRIFRFIWQRRIRMIWDHKSVFGFSQKTHPVLGLYLHDAMT